MAFPNVYTHRKVAETSAKPCDICFKPSTSVLITVGNKDWFFVCPSHLKDVGFCTPKIDPAAAEARRKRELEEEIERVKKEYEEKKRKKKEDQDKKTDNKSADKDKDKEKEKDGKADDGKKEDELGNESTDKAASPTSPTSPAAEEDEPRVFELKSTFYQQRLQKKRQIEIAKRNRERLQDPTFFPSVPKDLP
ncbi:VPS4-associated protein 1 [Lasiosphaeria ovina]|uniref:VPS4-associated protein 1 n=1 Tax=Lasiosphaeria ovina TaxID=92902 RepID=A0AAE0KIT0_9PEZI|nr:VPS4-associated protein 1 [Lasiosphaeria ovina]